ncbi:MAG: hypothetical protein WCE44_01010 [Candidatus Velthaea sp.]
MTDYEGVDAIRGSIYNVISALTVASFALSSFFLKDVKQVQGGISMVTDFAIICFIWGVFLVLKRDLSNRRKGLILRQSLIEGLDQESTDDFKVFADASNVPIDITDNDLFWIPVASTLAIVVKAALVWLLYHH